MSTDPNILIQKQENWISIVARIHITDVNGRVKFGDSAIGGEASNYASYSFFKEAQQKNTDQLFVHQADQRSKWPRLG